MYPEDALIPTANIILNFVLKPIRYEQFYKKYAAKKYYKVLNRPWFLRVTSLILVFRSASMLVTGQRACGRKGPMST